MEIIPEREGNIFLVHSILFQKMCSSTLKSLETGIVPVNGYSRPLQILSIWCSKIENKNHPIKIKKNHVFCTKILYSIKFTFFSDILTEHSLSQPN
jgi:hypothetical protein